jgi:Protein of unknown function (DUF3631)
MLAAGIGSFLAPTQKSRTFTLEMEPYTAETKPEREFDDADIGDLNAIYIFLRHWTARVSLDPKPAMPPGVLRRFADNVKGLLAIADSCGEAWGRRAREAVTALLEKERAERIPGRERDGLSASAPHGRTSHAAWEGRHTLDENPTPREEAMFRV